MGDNDKLNIRQSGKQQQNELTKNFSKKVIDEELSLMVRYSLSLTKAKRSQKTF